MKFKIKSCKYCPLEGEGFCQHPSASPSMDVTKEWDQEVVHLDCPFWTKKKLRLSITKDAIKGSRKYNMPKTIKETTKVNYPLTVSGQHFGCCPQCGSGDVKWCAISVRAYCNECNWWAPVNHGTKQDGLKKLHELQTRSEVETTNMI